MTEGSGKAIEIRDTSARDGTPGLCRLVIAKGRGLGLTRSERTTSAALAAARSIPAGEGVA